jgi:hypothetical protein
LLIISISRCKLAKSAVKIEGARMCVISNCTYRKIQKKSEILTQDLEVKFNGEFWSERLLIG